MTETAARWGDDVGDHAKAVTVTEHARRYFRAAYGPDYIYRAPETFSLLERWIWAVASDLPALAERAIADVEQCVSLDERPTP